MIVSQPRHEKRSRTVWITFHWRGITSSVSVTSSPSFDSLFEPQHGHADGAAMTMRSRGKCAGNGFRAGRRRSKYATWLDDAVRSAVSSSSVAAASASLELQFQLFEQALLALRAHAVQRALQLLDFQLQMSDQRVGLGGGTATLISLGFRRQPRRALGQDHRMSGGEIRRERFVRHNRMESQPPAIASQIAILTQLDAKFLVAFANQCRKEDNRVAPSISSPPHPRSRAKETAPAQAAWRTGKVPGHPTTGI